MIQLVSLTNVALRLKLFSILVAHAKKYKIKNQVIHNSYKFLVISKDAMHVLVSVLSLFPPPAPFVPSSPLPQQIPPFLYYCYY